ncbi:MAG: DUF4399 domain-containing protein [Kiloniellales bacterium]|nr:DUF4399 domain-containing protein [Kiloniellales bacterium]
MSKRTTMLALALGLALFALPGLAGETAAPAGAKVYFIGLADGDTVSSPLVVRFGLSGMGVAPAGIEKEGTGHHHLIVNAELPSLDEPIPEDENYRHFGGGQTEATIELPAGQHTLQLLLGDHNHIPHNPPVASERITITVR